MCIFNKQRKSLYSNEIWRNINRWSRNKHLRRRWGKSNGIQMACNGDMLTAAIIYICHPLPLFYHVCFVSLLKGIKLKRVLFLFIRNYGFLRTTLKLMDRKYTHSSPISILEFKWTGLKNAAVSKTGMGEIYNFERNIEGILVIM